MQALISIVCTINFYNVGTRSLFAEMINLLEHKSAFFELSFRLVFSLKILQLIKRRILLYHINELETISFYLYTH